MTNQKDHSKLSWPPIGCPWEVLRHTYPWPRLVPWICFLRARGARIQCATPARPFETTRPGNRAIGASFRPSQGIRLLSCRRQLFASASGPARASGLSVVGVSASRRLPAPARASGFSVVGVSSSRRLSVQTRQPGHQASQSSASALRDGFRCRQGWPGIRLLSCRRQLFALAFGAAKAARASGFLFVGVSSSRRLSAKARLTEHQASQMSASPLGVC